MPFAMHYENGKTVSLAKRKIWSEYCLNRQIFPIFLRSKIIKFLENSYEIGGIVVTDKFSNFKYLGS